MGKPGKRKAFCIQKVDITAPVDASKETRCTSATLGIVPSTVNTTDTIRKDAKNCCAQCGTFCGQRKGLKQSPFQDLKSLLTTWCKQATARSAMISVSLLREKVLCCTPICFVCLTCHPALCNFSVCPPSYLPAYSACPVCLFYLLAPPISPSRLPAFCILYPASRSAPRSPPSLLFGSIQVVCLCHEANFSSLIHCSC